MHRDEGHSPQPKTGEQRPQTRLILNLRRFQIQFLDHLALATGLDVSSICQKLIYLDSRPERNNSGDVLYSTKAQCELKSFSPETGGRGWKQLPILLDAPHFDMLCARAAESKSSSSTVMRHLLAQCMERHGFSSSDKFSQGRRRFIPRGMAPSSSYAGVGIACALVVLAIMIFIALPRGKTILTGPHWASANASLVFDPHTHTRYSDGKLAPAELVQRAVQGGCDALAITDHSDGKKTLSDQQLLDMQALREEHPDLLLFNGVELNIPSYGGREHAGLIAAPSVDINVLRQLRDLAERSLKRAAKGGAHKAFDTELLQDIADYQALHKGMLLIYNHPTRKDKDPSENVADITQWNAKSPVFTALEGAPGHQNAQVIGSYQEPYLTENRWDPAVATVGGAWDQLLSAGHQIWGALASSDYHNNKLDNPPCSFSRTHLLVPEPSYRGILMALKAGTFWADHGRILNQLWFSIDVEGLEQSTYPGYTVYVGDMNSSAAVALKIERGPGSFGQALSAEIIGNCRSGEAEILAATEIPSNSSEMSTAIPLAATGADGKSCTLRARVRLSRNAPTDFMAYTNPARFILD